MPAQTAPLSAWLVQEALSYAAQRGYNTAVEGTLRRPEVTLNTLAQFVERGATTHLVVLAVSEFDSWAGCIDRYLGLLEAGANARWTPLSAHDAGFAGTPVTLEAAASSGVVGRLSIVTRDGTALYDSQVTHGCPRDHCLCVVTVRATSPGTRTDGAAGRGTVRARTCPVGEPRRHRRDRPPGRPCGPT